VSQSPNLGDVVTVQVDAELAESLAVLARVNPARSSADAIRAAVHVFADLLEAQRERSLSARARKRWEWGHR
jgi:hypothetical protein